MTDRKIGPNLKKLMIRKMARDAVPPGTGNPMGAAIESMSDKGRMIALLREALVWCDEAISVMRSAPDNPYGDDEEVIAGAILAEIEKKK